MAKYILEEDAIKTTWMILNGLGYYEGDNVSLVNDVRDVFDTAPSVDVPERPGWISVNERLPKDEKDVLAYYGFKHDGVLSDQRFIGTLCYFRFDPNPHWQHEGQGKLTVTHWMPLPEPPKKEET